MNKRSLEARLAKIREALPPKPLTDAEKIYKFLWSRHYERGEPAPTSTVEEIQAYLERARAEREEEQ